MAMQWLSLCLLLLGCQRAVSQPVTPEERQQIETFIQGVIECKGLPGVLVSAVRNGQVALAEGYGQANIETGARVWPYTLFAIASVTKHFTGLLLSKIIAQRTDVTWDTPIQDILGEDFFYTTGYRTNNTCLRDLLSHKTGIPRNDMQWLLQMVNDRRDIITRLRYLEPVSDMRTSFIYTNIQFLLAGIVAETLEGRPWEDLIRQHFFGPIGMRDSTFVNIAGNDRQRFATPYVNTTGVLEEVPFEAHSTSGFVAPAASVASSAYDMSLWMNFLLSGRGSSGQQVMNMSDIEATWEMDAIGTLGPDEFNVFLKPRTPESWANSNYGKGLATGYYRGHRVISHGGDLFGYHSILIAIPDLNVGAFISINVQHVYERRLMALHILDVLTGQQPWLNVSYACNDFPPPMASPGENMADIDVDVLRSRQADLPQQKSPMAREDGEYVGMYGNFGYGNATVSLGGDSANLTLTLEARFGTFELLPVEDDIFLCIGVRDAWFISLGPIEFSSSQGSGGPIDQFVIPILEQLNPPVYRRDLKMSEAPIPRLDTC